MFKEKFLNLLNIFSGIVCLITGIVLTLEFGFHLTPQNETFFGILHNFVFTYFIIDILFRLILRGPYYFITHLTDLAIFIGLTNQIMKIHITQLYLTQLAMLIIMLGRLIHIHSFFKRLKFKPAQMLLIGFLFSIFIGSILLSLPIATHNTSIPYADAIFTATSAICVTGLVVNDISSTFTIFGQSVIMILIQIGGLGIMVLSVLLARVLNRKMSHRETQEFQESYSTTNISESFHILMSIFKFTFLFEAIGAICLFIFWQKDFENIFQAIFASVFHAISAFCNAGFSLFSNSFIGYATTPPIILTIAILIIIGGIGFPVIVDLTKHTKKRKIKTPFRLHTKIVICTTIALIIIGATFIYHSEYNHSLTGFSFGEKCLISFFQSVTSRTAGFNSIDLNFFKNSTLFLLITLMYIGASPGSTGGGIKTSTVGVLLLTTWNTLRSRNKTEVGGRTISNENTLKSLSIIVLSAITISTFLYIILSFENQDFIKILFETISAFGTVGLSLGITKYLSIWSKMFIMVLMFIGRVGPLTIAFALSRQKAKTNFTYPEENILIA
jgi:trk system potassium uptake protein